MRVFAIYFLLFLVLIGQVYYIIVSGLDPQFASDLLRIRCLRLFELMNIISGTNPPYYYE